MTITMLLPVDKVTFKLENNCILVSFLNIDLAITLYSSNTWQSYQDDKMMTLI